MNRKINKVAILGSGVMGSGIACHFANIGVEVILLDLIPKKKISSKHLYNAMKYIIDVGGKRLRPIFLTEISNLLGVKKENSFRTAASVELIHCYSLVHDDLPSMDKDDLRRGHKTCHKKFDEATAILVGDALQLSLIHI